MPRTRRRATKLIPTFLLLGLALASVDCGGTGSGGPGPEGAGQGLVLVSFRQDGIDNLALNERLRFTFSEALDPETVTQASIQIREGPSFGRGVRGTLTIEGSTVIFEPDLPGRCDYSDAGFQPETQYRISVVGSPEEYCVRNSVGQPLETTTTCLVRTRSENIFLDGAPGVSPYVVSSTPADGSAEVKVAQGNEVVLDFNENIDPCSITPDSITFRMHEVGDINDGFIPVEDSSVDPLSWGSTNGVTTVNPAQTVPASIVLEQDFESTQVRVTPEFGEFPENALLVLTLTSQVLDYGGNPLVPRTIAFTAENLDGRSGVRSLEYDDTTPIDGAGTTADVNTSRAPDRAQGYLLFSGDGDNGADPYTPGHPNSSSSGCRDPLQENDSEKDDFFPGTDEVLDTGSTVNACPNTVDGSTAVVWEFKSFRIPSGVTVRIKGVNPAIILVQEEIVIESGGTLLVRGDGKDGVPQGRGANGSATNTNGTKGGVGVAGGGNGGSSPAYPSTVGGRYGGHGVQGYFTTSSGTPDVLVGKAPGTGGGESNSSGYWVSQALCNRNVPSGGGGGHATEGQSGIALGSGSTPVKIELTLMGAGGDTYPTNDRMIRAEAGSGGGAGGELRSSYGTPARGPGGAGGAGGGFVDLTCSGEIKILGTIDASGGAGGKGAGNPFNPNYTYNPGTGGGGGGSGGGIRLITASNITLGPTTVITAAGGAGGAGGSNQGTAQPVNPGGAGGMGRIAMEDRDSVITGLASALVVPSGAGDGFYRGVFDPSRFSGGGLSTEALTQPFLAGPIPIPGITPTYREPVQGDFVASIPQQAGLQTGDTGILMEARGWLMNAEGTVDESAGPTEWSTVGSFADSGTESEPRWLSAVTEGIPTDITLAPDNPGVLVGLASLKGYGFVQIRLTFYLPSSATPLTPGPYIDSFALRFDYDQ